MENSLKQRIVGAIVLIALAVIFLPAILKEKTQQAPFESQIPEKPETLKTFSLTPAQRSKSQQVHSELDQKVVNQRKVRAQHEQQQQQEYQAVAQALQDEIALKQPKAIEQQDQTIATETVAEKEPALPAKKKPTPLIQRPAELSQQPQPDTWLLQVASFSQQANANRLVDKLRESGLIAYARQFTVSQKPTIYRVYSGPYMTNEDALRAKEQVAKLAGTQGLVLKYDPLKH
ncbi:SPOR domain-containing protein [Aliikangiella sp. IMCC44632]